MRPKNPTTLFSNSLFYFIFFLNLSFCLQIPKCSPQSSLRLFSFLPFLVSLDFEHSSSRFQPKTRNWNLGARYFSPLFSKFSAIREPSHHFAQNSCEGNLELGGLNFYMGEAPAFLVHDLKGGFLNLFGLKSKGCETATVIGNKTYVVDGGCDESLLSFRVRVYDHSTGTWIDLVVLGTIPETCKGHSAIAVNDRILFIKGGSPLDDSFWFLEVDTPYVREQSKSMDCEVVAWSKGVRGTVEKPIVVSGPSGVGKGTLISMLMKECPSLFGFSVSHTTRAPRNMEKDGLHYHFTKRSIMENDIKEGKFLEFASVHGNLYGTSVEAVEVVADAGKRCILDIDVQGAWSVSASSLDAIFIFICPPSMAELEKRLRARGTETEEQILKRLRNAEAEIKHGESSGIFDHFLFNDNLENCYESLKKLLGLDGRSDNTCTKSTPEDLDLPPIVHSVSRIDNKIIITFRTSGVENESRKTIVLDLSSLQGSAPGRTRGLDLYPIDLISNGSNIIDQPS